MSSAAKDKPQPAKESPTSEVEEDSEYTTSSSDEGGEGSSSRAALFGALRTRLRWDVDSRTLNLDVRCGGSTQQQGGRQAAAGVGVVVGLCCGVVCVCACACE